MTDPRSVPSTVRRVLVANRGEIARRVFATCRRLGIGTVAVHSEADAGLPFVAEADVAVPLPGSTPAETYLRADLVLEAARRAGADAVHPGYGFLSENADFARAVISAGLVWIGPTPDSIEQMGSKVGAKQLMRRAGVPVLEAPADPGPDDLPLLVKASAGGGGRGMRVVRELARLDAEVAVARAEAESAFGDGTVFVEPYVERGRHVEVQVVGDAHGQVLVLGERDCSLQRRHQKVVEEAPAPGLPEETRQALHTAARQAAEAIDYVGAGTVEFLYDPASGRFFFLEMNTRLQVEHPVTEAVFGVDLVALQILVAEGGSVRESSTPAPPGGHAIEARLYAEDTAGYVPQSGTLVDFEVPHDAAFEPTQRAGVRLDAGFATGDEVSTFYDAMLAKVVARAPTRQLAARMLAGALERASLHGVTTNRDQLVGALRDPDFLAGDVSTAFLGEHDLTVAPVDLEVAAFAGAVLLAEHEAAERRVQHGTPVAWRNVVSQPQRTTLVSDAGEVAVEWYGGRDGYRHATRTDLSVVTASPEEVLLDVDGVRVRTRNRGLVGDASSGCTLYLDHGLRSVLLRVPPRFTDPADAVAAGSLLAPMPGSVVAVRVGDGERVSAGQTVFVLEAMKMQHTVTAPGDGVVSIEVAVGDQVAAGDVLAVVEEDA